MIELFVDTETTGFVHASKPTKDPSQPHVVQLAMILREDGEEIGHADYIVKCPVPIPPKVTAIHGISDERAQRQGVTPMHACQAFSQWAEKADRFIAFNAGFDRQVLEIALDRVNIPIPWTYGELLDGLKNWHCVMEMAEPYCKIPATEKQIKAGRKKRGDFKQPKLSEAVDILLGTEMVNAHNARADVGMCLLVYDWINATAANDELLKSGSLC